MAIGEALYEELIREKGKTLNNTFLDYKLPTFMEVPGEMESVFIEVPHKESPYGNIGMGEAVALGASAAIGNAIYNAIGVRIKELPITGEKILKALAEKKACGK